MGFIGQSDRKAPQADQDAIHVMLAAGDLAGAWFALPEASNDEPAFISHSRAVCLLQAGRNEEALTEARKAFTRLTTGIPQRPFDSVGDLLVPSSRPWPMHPGTPVSNPTYAGLQARWMLALCLRACGRLEEAEQVSAPLARYHIETSSTEEEKRCRRWTTCF